MKSASHLHLSKFVDWIRAEPATEKRIQEQATEVRQQITSRATKDGVVVRSTPWSGSFEKKTGLRRHIRGKHEIEGQDIDLPFVLSPKDKDGETLDKLLDRFEAYAQASYRNTSRTRTQSSIRLDFKESKLSYDLVPMIAVENDDKAQFILRTDGERRLTSVQKHVDFVKTRNDKSSRLNGPVKFNEVVRLVKWWREVRQAQSTVLVNVPTIVIELLCAKAFDTHGIDETYTETLSHWFGQCADLVRNRQRIEFMDFVNSSSAPSNSLWTILDPVNAKNNVVPSSWSNREIDELSQWFETARNTMTEVIKADIERNEPAALSALVVLFGPAIKDRR